ncbi:MAG: NADH-quinone oxidoreductase subunit L [Acidimicrobiia bacterium]
MVRTLTDALVLAAEGLEPVPVDPGITSGWAVENAWIILVLPFLAALAIVLIGKRDEKWGHRLAIGMMGWVFLHAAWLWFLTMTEGVIYEQSFLIGDIGSGLAFELGWVIDGLSSMMLFVVGTVALVVYIYAVGYMEGEARYAGFFSAISLFAGAMLVLVAAPNLVQLIIGWELVGVASYLLIGHYWEEKENSSAGMKAFYVNKVADIGLIIGAIVLATSVGTFNIAGILDAAEAGNESISAVAVVGALLLFFGAMGKSAQFPLHVWLPDAMAGPTPVSALMHAATMVTAGVYLLGRMFPLYEGIAADARPWIMLIGGLTLFLTGLIALVQWDLKKVLAYSTLSQLGYMVLAMGAGAYTAGLFHLFTHAFFKALLFLGAGSVIHAVHSNDMRDMGGMRKSMPVTFWTFIVGSLALAGIPPLAGFFSKDEILASLTHASGPSTNVVAGIGIDTLFFWVAVGGALITAFYMTRAVALTFFGQYKGHAHPHESPRSMTVPLVILAAFSATVGFLNVPGVFKGMTNWLAIRTNAIVEFIPSQIDFGVAAIGLTAGVIGIASAWWLFSRDADTQTARDRFRIPGLYPLLEAKYYIDELYLGMVAFIKGPLARFVDWTNGHVIDAVVNGVAFATASLGRVVYGFDQSGIDLAINGLAGAAGGGGGLLRRLQSGRVQQYAAAFLLGAVFLAVGFVLVT